MRPVCNDKNCQSAKCAHMQQRAMLQSTYKKSSSKKNLQVKSELAKLTHFVKTQDQDTA